MNYVIAGVPGLIMADMAGASTPVVIASGGLSALSTSLDHRAMLVGAGVGYFGSRYLLQLPVSNAIFAGMLVALINHYRVKDSKPPTPKHTSPSVPITGQLAYINRDYQRMV
jgi:hypothetical protein